MTAEESAGDQDFENLFKPVEMSEDEKQLRIWLEKNRNGFLRDRSRAEAVYWAVKTGVVPKTKEGMKLACAVCSTLKKKRNFPVDIEAALWAHIDIRAAKHVWEIVDAGKRVKLMETQMQEARERSKKFSLLPSWKSLRAHLVTGEEIQ